MNVRIKVKLNNNPLKEFLIEGKVTEITSDDVTPEREIMLISGTLFQMEYALNEHVPYLRCHIEAGLDLLPQDT
jgi:hypothetical protein